MLNDGTYNAVATAASVWEAPSGALMIAFDFDLTDEGFEGQSIRSNQCLGQKDGTISEITLRTLKDCWGLPGYDPFWLQDPANLADKPVELVVEQEVYKDKPRAVVKYINPPGGSALPKPADRDKVLAKFGSRLRALSGGTKPAPKLPAPKAPPKPKPAPPSGPTSDVQECWNLFCTSNESLNETDLSSAWDLKLKEVFPGKDQGKLTPQDWGKLKADIEAQDKLPM